MSAADLTPSGLPPVIARATASGVAGIVAVLVIAAGLGGLPVSQPLWVYIAAAVAVVGGMLVGRVRLTTDATFLITALAGQVLLAMFAIDVASAVPVAVWWPMWGLHATTTAYSLTGVVRQLSGLAGLTSLVAVVVLAGVPTPLAVLHVGSYLILSGLVMALARHHHDITAERQEAAATVATRTQVLSTLARMNSFDTDEVAREAVAGLAAAGYEMGTFGAVDPATDLVHSVASIGFEPDMDLDEPVPSDHGVAGEAFRRGRSVVIEDYARWSGRLADRDEVGGAVGVPVLIDGERAAVLLGGRSTPGAPTADQLEVIELLAAQAARVLLTARQFHDQRRNAERLAELDHLKDDFIASVTHELRTPLTVIRGVAETLGERGAAMDTPVRAELLRRLIRQSDRLDELIAALLYLSQLEAGSVQARLGGTDAGQLVELAVARATARRPRAVSVEVPANTEVRCDPDLIARVLEQLVANALVHNPEATQVEVRVEATPETVRFLVVDDGTGIDPGDARHLTQRFFRGGPSTRRTSSGLGLGLAIADHLLEIHGSRLAISSARGVGTTASFELPTARRSAVPEGQATAPELRSSSTSPSA